MMNDHAREVLRSVRELHAPVRRDWPSSDGTTRLTCGHCQDVHPYDVGAWPCATAQLVYTLGDLESAEENGLGNHVEADSTLSTNDQMRLALSMLTAACGVFDEGEAAQRASLKEVLTQHLGRAHDAGETDDLTASLFQLALRLLVMQEQPERVLQRFALGLEHAERDLTNDDDPA